MKYLKYFLLLLLVLLVIGFLAGVWFFKLRATERAYPESPTLTTKIDAGQTPDYNENRNAYFYMFPSSTRNGRANTTRQHE